MAKVTPVHMEFIVLGQPVSMKNRRRNFVHRYTGKSMSIKSPEAMQYEEDFLKQIPPKFKLSIKSKVRVKVVAYYASERPDLDCELICDCLQKGRVLKNDRQIVEKYFIKRLDKDSPRAEIEIGETLYCEHGKLKNDYCLPCGRINGGG